VRNLDEPKSLIVDLILFVLCVGGPVFLILSLL